MTSTAVSAGAATSDASAARVPLKLEVITIPVADVERSKAFYQGLGWRLDADFVTPDDHVIQFTPPGSECSIHFGTNLTTAAPGSAQGLFLIVSDIEAARKELAERGAEVTEVFHFTSWNRIAPGARASGPAGTYGTFASFNDPDGNSWLVQEITTRLPGRIDPHTTTYRSVADLAGAMRRASIAHGEHEKLTGEYDVNWPDWYAAYMVAEQSGEPLPT